MTAAETAKPTEVVEQTAAEYAFAEARAQGLPAHVEDPTVLGNVATILLAAGRAKDGDTHASS